MHSIVGVSSIGEHWKAALGGSRRRSATAFPHTCGIYVIALVPALKTWLRAHPWRAALFVGVINHVEVGSVAVASFAIAKCLGNSGSRTQIAVGSVLAFADYRGLGCWRPAQREGGPFVGHDQSRRPAKLRWR